MTPDLNIRSNMAADIMSRKGITGNTMLVYSGLQLNSGLEADLLEKKTGSNTKLSRSLFIIGVRHSGPGTVA